MADSTRGDTTKDTDQSSDPRRGGVGGAGAGLDQVTSGPADAPGAGTEATGPGADAGVTSGSRATGTGANLGETEAIGGRPDGGRAGP